MSQELFAALELLEKEKGIPKELMLEKVEAAHVSACKKEFGNNVNVRVAIDTVCRRHSDRVSYFPSYEILIDDLRDYRFYGEDLVHPSRQAVEYITEKFCEAALSPTSKTLMAKVENIVRALNHRPNNPRSEAYKRFCEAQLRSIEEIKGVDLSEERASFERLLQINL